MITSDEQLLCLKRTIRTHTSPSVCAGPDVADGLFRPVQIKSIHYKRLHVGQVVAGQTAAMALKKVKRAQVGLPAPCRAGGGCSLVPDAGMTVVVQLGRTISLLPAPSTARDTRMRPQVRKGMVLVDERLKPVASWEFDASISVLTHSTTIQPRYQVSKGGGVRHASGLRCEKRVDCATRAHACLL